MNVSGESRREINDRRMEILSAKTKTRIGFWNVRTMYETGKLAQVKAEMRRYNLDILVELVKADGQDQAGMEPTQQRPCDIVVGTATNTTRESPSSCGKEWRSA